ncbi:MAG: cell division protein SepF [Actinomycetota bacterium]|nr:cell division protein SepF [Actinomycetota bacterium]
MLSYLGLTPEDEYGDYDAYDERPVSHHSGSAVQPVPTQTQPSQTSQPYRPAPAPDDTVAAQPPMSAVRPISAVPDEDRSDSGSRSGAVVRPLTPAPAKIHVVTPAAFADAKEIADHFKAEQAVILSLQESDSDLKRRLLDFASGLCYALGGSMEKVSNVVFLLIPADVELSAEDKRRLRERGLYGS